jgi:predicted phage baseplate assembly protein
VLALRRCDRAVTADDFQALALAADNRVVRAHCIPRRDITRHPNADAPSHVSVALLPRGGGAPPADLLAAVAAWLEPRRLLTSKVHVAGVRMVDISVTLTLNLTGDAVAATTQAAAVAALTGFLDPLTGGDQATGWPFGRAVYVSEIYRLLGRLPGVDYVSRTGTQDEISSKTGTELRNGAGELIGIGLAADQLVTAAIDPGALTLIAPVRH